MALLVVSSDLYERVSSGKVKWDKSEGLLLGQWAHTQIPQVPGKPQLGAVGHESLGGFSQNREVSEEDLGGCYGESVCLTV